MNESLVVREDSRFSDSVAIAGATSTKPSVLDQYNMIQEDATRTRILASDEYGFNVRFRHCVCMHT